MFENKLSISVDNKEKELAKNNTPLAKRKPQFKEILCPKTGKALDSFNCSKCTHKEELRRAHPLGLTLSTFICNWDETNKS